MDDRRALLAVHDAIARRADTFSYLEIGSHLGGSMQSFIADTRCSQIVSIDPRPREQPDDRGQLFVYENNSTARMLALLASVPGADLTKLEAIERGTGDLEPNMLRRPDLCLIDGEHTYAAALRDARFCRAAVRGEGVVLFHDQWVVESAIVDFVRETPGRLTAYPMRGALFAVEIGARPSLLAQPGVAAHVIPAAAPWRIAARTGTSRSLVRAMPHVRHLRNIRRRG